MSSEIEDMRDDTRDDGRSSAVAGRKLLFVIALAFIAGALVMLMVRGAVTEDGAPTATATGVDQDGHDGEEGASDEHAGHGDDEHAGHGDVEHAGHGDDEHAGHGDDEHAGHGAKPDEHADTTAELWVCEQDPSIGLSYEGTCPLDGKPMVKKEVDLGEVTDVDNEKCPIMGGDVNEDIYAIYHGKKVSFCCAACDKDFFKDAEQHIRDLESSR